MEHSDLELARAKSALSNCAVGHTIQYYPSVASTMILAHEVCQTTIPSGMVILTEQQTQGRGRLNRRWETPFGKALLLTIILGPDQLQVPIAHLSILTAVAARSAITMTLPALASRIVFKWPNDILGLTHNIESTRMSKVAGLLTEATFLGSNLQYAIAGIGINVNQNECDLPQLAGRNQQPTSLRLLAGHSLDRTTLLINLCKSFSKLCNQAEQNLLYEWKKHLHTLGQSVIVTEIDDMRHHKQKKARQYAGTAIDITADGHLVVENTQGERRTFSSAEVTLRSGSNVLDDV